jgi:hypothetical protein
MVQRRAGPESAAITAVYEAQTVTEAALFCADPAIT